MTWMWVIDTETSNTGIWHPEPGGHIVEFSAVKVNLEDEVIGPSYSAIICDIKADPSAWVFQNTDLNYMDVLRGVNPSLFGDYMARILKGQTVTAFNTEFDRLMIERDMPTINWNVEWGQCLMKTAARIEEIPRKHAGGNAYPTAEATYNYLCPHDPCHLNGKEKHRAYSDALMESYILLELNRRGLIEC